MHQRGPCHAHVAMCVRVCGRVSVDMFVHISMLIQCNNYGTLVLHIPRNTFRCPGRWGLAKLVHKYIYVFDKAITSPQAKNITKDHIKLNDENYIENKYSRNGKKIYVQQVPIVTLI